MLKIEKGKVEIKGEFAWVLSELNALTDQVFKMVEKSTNKEFAEEMKKQYVEFVMESEEELEDTFENLLKEASREELIHMLKKMTGVEDIDE